MWDALRAQMNSAVANSHDIKMWLLASNTFLIGLAYIGEQKFLELDQDSSHDTSVAAAIPSTVAIAIALAASSAALLIFTAVHARKKRREKNMDAWEEVKSVVAGSLTLFAAIVFALNPNIQKRDTWSQVAAFSLMVSEFFLQKARTHRGDNPRSVQPTAAPGSDVDSSDEEAQTRNPLVPPQAPGREQTDTFGGRLERSPEYTNLILWLLSGMRILSRGGNLLSLITEVKKEGDGPAQHGTDVKVSINAVLLIVTGVLVAGLYSFRRCRRFNRQDDSASRFVAERATADRKMALAICSSIALGALLLISPAAQTRNTVMSWVVLAATVATDAAAYRARVYKSDYEARPLSR